MRGQRAGHDDVPRAALDHVGQHVVHVLHHHIDIELQHAVDGVRVGIDEIAAHIQPRVGMKDVQRSCNSQRALQQAGALPGIQQIEHQRRSAFANDRAGLGQRGLVAVDQHHARARIGHGLGAGKAYARGRASDGRHLALEWVLQAHDRHAACRATTRPWGSNQWACEASMSRLTASPARRPVRSFWRATNCAPPGCSRRSGFRRPALPPGPPGPAPALRRCCAP